MHCQPPHPTQTPGPAIIDIERLAARTIRYAVAGVLAIASTLTAAVPAEAQTNVVTAWNVIATSVTGNWRAPTIAHLAIHDSLNAIDRRFEPYAIDEWARQTRLRTLRSLQLPTGS